MASYQRPAGSHHGGKIETAQIPRQMGREPTPMKQYPPPQLISEYAHKALPVPPRPQSSASSVYDPEDASFHQTNPKQHLTVNRSSESRGSFAGAIDESALAMVRPPQIDTTLSQSYQQREIASPQPKHPSHKLLSLNTRNEDNVSPILTPESGNKSHLQHIVSPMSEHGSFEDPTAEFIRPHTTIGIHSTPQTAQSRSASGVSSRNGLRPQIQKINSRYSDPGSPSGGVSLEAFPRPGAELHQVERSYEQQPVAKKSAWRTSLGGIWPNPSAQKRPASSAGRRVSFAGPKIESFSSHRPATSHRPLPPPLKLNERAESDEYVKTPFPPRSNSDASPTSQHSVFEEDEKVIKRPQRMSSFGTILRPGSSRKNEGAFVLPTDGDVKMSPTSKGKVMDMLSRAKHGLGLGSEEAKKEKRREELKKQIRMGEPS
ncbi:hypothetical protein F4780DRAFT_278782 [Xylariomycetidae sp. FL0641]|nr:hypothetical protein F4780DRAFT_278782 [Xylariomycetidae sp. FL0641]